MTPTQQADIQQLNSFLRGEISAVETYDQAIEKFSSEPDVAAALRSCQASHENRVRLLRTRIQQLGGEPADGSSFCGGFARRLEGGAKAFAARAAIGALERGDDHGRDDYHRDLDDVSPAVQDFVRSQLVPEQQQTHARLSALKQQLAR
jgi:uncharacterized protein (TIGR02284 family)